MSTLQTAAEPVPQKEDPAIAAGGEGEEEEEDDDEGEVPQQQKLMEMKQAEDGGMPPPQVAPIQVQQPMSTTNCVYCQCQLSYPQNSIYIQCPKCANTMNPQAPHTNYMNCIGCGTLLSHPPSSLTIQCPKCLVIMELPMRMNMFQNPGFGGGGGGGGGGSRKSRKKRKDPNAPKRASNAYMIFCKERRAKLKEEHPDLPFGKLGAKLGEMWRVMTVDEKKPYETRASNDRDRYKKEMNNYQGATGIGVKTQGVPGVAVAAGSDEKGESASKKQKLDGAPAGVQPMAPNMQMPMMGMGVGFPPMTAEQQQHMLTQNPAIHHQLMLQQQAAQAAAMQRQAMEQQQRAMQQQLANQAAMHQVGQPMPPQQFPTGTEGEFGEEAVEAEGEDDGDDFDEEQEPLPE